MRNKHNIDTSTRGKLRRTVDGILFASLAEADRYLYLKIREMAGEISDLELQPRYELQPAFVAANGKKIRRIDYVADFRYQEDGRGVVVEEVKGHATAVFKLKAKMFQYKYPGVTFDVVPA